jgi:hypothetical protein
MKDHDRNNRYGTQTVDISAICGMVVQVVGEGPGGKLFQSVFYWQNILLSYCGCSWNAGLVL